ncbi:RNA-dependent RNA polymerase 1-like [Stegodyphus dumicola]|uniref:RNA-dependent RNA polymerase 1-like n=1 Tax=Stegodyphus dumicola TaxID=202533 RepID=UPI0015B2E8EA|nr:RNA-dependent RNA polymerase 1-like [Stegodyphus dumicola]XP_035212895.1 RNA-dependent RNA polymerase 1-like [Stegodyphus dumicola]
MAENTLKFAIVFRANITNEDHVRKKTEEFFEIFHRMKNFNSETNILKPRNIDTDPIYQAKLYEMEVHIKILDDEDHFQSGDYCTKVFEEWCNERDNVLSKSWLRLINCSGLEKNFKQFHCDVRSKEIAFGTFPNMQQFVQQYQFAPEINDGEIISTFLHDLKQFIVYIYCNHENCNKFRFVVDYKAIVKVLVDTSNEENMQIFFNLQHIPVIYREKKKEDDKQKRCIENEMCSGEKAVFLVTDQEYQEKYWERTLTFGCEFKNSVCHLSEIGGCLVFKIVFPEKFIVNDVIERLIQRCSSNTHFYYSHIRTVVPKIKYPNIQNLPFGSLRSDSKKNADSNTAFSCQFAWEAIIRKSFEIRDQLNLKQNETESDLFQLDLVKRRLNAYFNCNAEALVNSLYHISEMIDRRDIFTFCDALAELFEYYLWEESNELELPEEMCLVRRMIITPSRIMFLQPYEHFNNRVIRKYEADNMLKVLIQEDNSSSFTPAVRNHSEAKKFMDDVMGKTLKEGIWIGPRHYELLASSNSQLKEHSVWMYAKDEKGNTAESIRKWMGDFSHIKSVAKYMARMGQCFSSSTKVVPKELGAHDIVYIKDIKSGDGKYIFSDGVGMISKELAMEVRKVFQEKPSQRRENLESLYQASAFQIRFKGCKGMITETPSLPGRQLRIRPSMEKFKCESSSHLEIIKQSAPRAMFLNRPFITILEQLGVKPQVFLELQKDMMFDLTESLINDKKAYKTLKRFTSLDYPYNKLFRAGISISEEPFFRSLLLSIYKTAIGKLQSKTNIAVPPESGRNMLGVLDETKTLEYGEVFVQYSTELDNTESETVILERTVVVTKNPCMHPGDVRKLQAVDVPALHHIKDCIVFPAKGKRPHPDEMAGSDLDGDEYIVIWLDDLVFPNDNVPPMEYTPNKETIHEGEITVSDMTDFFYEYLMNGDVGILGSAHLAWADKEGIFSEVCMDIAKKYALAVDFAKSGSTCSLQPNERPKYYPDFMQKGFLNNSYVSKNALGLLFRVARNLESCVNRIDALNQPIFPDSSLEYSGWEIYEQKADNFRKKYANRVKSILKKYGLKNEIEVLSGYISETKDSSQNIYDVTELCKLYFLKNIKSLRLKFDKICLFLLKKSGNSLEDIKHRMASAWYMVTYRNSDTSVLSFPWIVSDILCEVRERNLGRFPSAPKMSFIKTSDIYLLEQFSDFVQKSYVCCCTSILQITVEKWIRKSSESLGIIKSENDFCDQFIQRISSNFQENSRKKCCSFKRNKCSCEKKGSCSPMKLILEFLRFYASEGTKFLENSQALSQEHKDCDNFLKLNLQSVALQTYAAVAVSRDYRYLGLVNDTSTAFEEDGSYEESYPFRVPVDEIFQSFITHDVDEVKRILKSESGVREIFIKPGKVGKGGWFLLVNSVGTVWQRWKLEQLLMDQNISTFIGSTLQNSYHRNHLSK